MNARESYAVRRRRTRTTKAQHGWGELAEPTLDSTIEASHRLLVRRADGRIPKCDDGRARISTAGTIGPAIYRIVPLDGELELFRREISRAIVASGACGARPTSDSLSKKIARYCELHNGRRARLVVAVLELHLSCRIHELRLIVSKRRTAEEQLVYERLAKFVLGRPSLDVPALAVALRCHPRTVDRMLKYAAQDNQNQEATVVDIKTKQPVLVIEHRHTHTHEVRVTVERPNVVPAIPDEELAAVISTWQQEAA